MDDAVEMLEELNGLEVFTAAVTVRDPFASRPAVVAVKHGCHRIDAQSVDMIMLEPLKGAGDQKAFDLVATEIVDQCIPILVKTLTGVFVLIERRPVETRQTPDISREVRRHPVEDDADPGAMAAVDKVSKILWCAIAAGWRKQAERLVAP